MTGFVERILFLPLLGFCVPLGAQNHEQEIHRALVQRDQQAAEFAAGLRGEAARARLEILHEQQRRELPLAPEFLPYQRQRMADERVFILAPPVAKSGSEPDFVLPLPGGPKAGVDPVLPQGLPY